MTEIITEAAALTPIGAVLVLAALAQVVLVQTSKQQAWSKTTTQRVSAAVAAVVGIAAAVLLGMIAGIPDSIVQIVSSILLSIAAVAVLGQGLYKIVGYAIPDCTAELPVGSGNVHVVVNATEDPEAIAWALSAQQRGRRADRDGAPDGRDTPTEGLPRG
jgi:hypothetical protein